MDLYFSPLACSMATRIALYEAGADATYFEVDPKTKLVQNDGTDFRDINPLGLVPTLPVAAVGVAVWGLGAALAVPIGIAAASDDPRRAASRVAAVSVLSSIASISAPPLLGLAAESMGARHALLLVTNMQAGHGGASGRYDYLKEIALDYAFLLRELGLTSA